MGAPLFEDLLGGAPAAICDQGGQVDLVEQVTLGVTAADFRKSGQGGFKFADRLLVGAGEEGGDADGCWEGDFGPGRARERGRGLGPLADSLKQGWRFLAAGA